MNSDFGYTHQSFEELCEEEIKLFEEMDQHINHVSSTHQESYPRPLNEEPRSQLRPSMEEPPKLELKPLPDTLKYAYLGADESPPVIIAANMARARKMLSFSF